MGSAGHADNSIGNVNNNINLLRNNRNRYAKVKEAYLRHEAHYSPVRHRKLSPEQLHELKKKIRTRIIFERRRSFLLSIVFTFPIILGIVYLFMRCTKILF